jgi:hypothetical protein
MSTKKPRGLHRRRRNPVKVLLSASAAVLVAVTIGLFAAGSTYALWSDKATPTGAVLQTGSIGLTINNVASYAIPDLATSQLLPGRTVITSTPLTLKNTGDVPLSVTLGATVFPTANSADFAGQLTVYVRQAASCSITPAGTTPTTLTAPISLALGATTTVCVEVMLSTTAPSSLQGKTAAFTVPFNAIQVRP